MTNSPTGASAPPIAIIGGGIIGCALAYDLARRGLRPLLIDRQQLGREASGASAGIISPPGAAHGERAELALHGFRRHHALLPVIADQTGIAAGASPRGVIRLGLEAEHDALRASYAWQCERGIAAEWLDAAALREREPALHEQYRFGVANPEASSVLLGQFALGLARAAAQAGATIREHLPVTGLVRSGDRVTAIDTGAGRLPVGGVVIAAGAWSGMFADQLGYPIPVLPVRGQMMAVNDVPQPLHSVVVHQGNYLVPRADGSIAVGATEEADAGFNGLVSPAGIAYLAEAAAALAPSLNDGRLVSHWYGLRPGTTLSAPLIGRVPDIGNAWLATGHFRGGAVLATATSEFLTETIITGQQHPLLAACDPAQYSA